MIRTLSPRLAAATCLLTTVCCLLPWSAKAADEKKAEFAKETIDVGLVVADVEKSVKFYTQALGFEEIAGFTVSADFAKNVGLTSAQLDVHVLVLGKGETATKLKLMQLKGVDAKHGDNEFIHSHLGFRYLTIYVSDTTAAVARLEKAGIKPVAKTPAEIPKEIAPGAWLTIVRDPDGNMIELAGPKK